MMCTHCGNKATHHVRVGNLIMVMCGEHTHVATQQAIETGTMIEVRLNR